MTVKNFCCTLGFKDKTSVNNFYIYFELGYKTESKKVELVSIFEMLHKIAITLLGTMFSSES